MSLAQRFAQIFGAVYLLVGILGFIPPLIPGQIQGLLGPFEPLSGFLLGLFAVNWLHSVAHLAIGAAGLASYRSHTAARSYGYRHWGALPGALRDRLDLATRFRTFAAERRGQHPSSRIWRGRPGHWPGLVGSRRHQIPRLETLFRRRVEAPIVDRLGAPYYCFAPGRGAPSRAACLGL